MIHYSGDQPQLHTQLHKDELRHGKMRLKIFVIVIPKKKKGSVGRANPAFGVTSTIEFVVVIPKEGLAGRANPSFGMTPPMIFGCVLA